MKIKIKKIIFCGIVSMVIGMVSCESYLDMAPEASISEADVFSNYRNFAGFTDELYACIVDYSKTNWTCEWNWADETFSATDAPGRMNTQFDNGNYWAWTTTSGESWLMADGVKTTNGDAHWHGLWPNAWYAIRKANLGLANMDKFVDGTESEKNAIKGQLLFFRGFFYFELMSFFGGLPYIKEVLVSQKLDFPRLNYRETALLAAQDFAEAATLLPANWDTDPVGQATLGKNNQRVTKSVAYAYLGKNLLYAASPLMNQESTGNASYDAELCKQAAEAFYNCLKLSDDNSAFYKLMPWDNYNQIFWTLDGTMPGGTEILLAAPNICKYRGSNSRWGLTCQYVPREIGGDGADISPAANYVKYYGMANGLPIGATGSGYNESDPWSGRDPRFYQAITIDGTRMIQGTDQAAYRYADLFNGGIYRNDAKISRSGYMMHKFICPGSNTVDKTWDGIIIVVPYMRLADVYLMYAESVLHGYGTPQSSYPGYLSAIDAVNKVRERANVPNVDARYLNTKEDFMEQLIRERAVELAFEGHRFLDLRRWLLAGEKKYCEKTAIDFDRGTDGKPINMRERVVVTRVFEKKHNWLPLPLDQVNLYPSFNQNPGW
jgi:hypothetical protein